MISEELAADIFQTTRAMLAHSKSATYALYHGSVLEQYALIIAELGEAIECRRKSKPILFDDPKSGKPEGELSELADVVIRILNLCEARGWDLEAAIRRKNVFNKLRDWSSEGKKI